MNNNSNKRNYEVEVKIYDTQEYEKAVKKLMKEIHQNSYNRNYYYGRLILEDDYTIIFATTSRREALDIFGLVTTYEEWNVKIESTMK